MTACRMCFGGMRTMLSLTPTPIANSFSAYPDQDAERFPLNVQQCTSCDHVQQEYLAQIDWTDYHYATPAANRPHLELAAENIRARYPSFKTAWEIGSNNGLYRDILTAHGFTVTGVDPNTTVGIKAPFSLELVKGMESTDLIVANNVLAHVDNLSDVFMGIDRLLKDDGALVFEVQYMPDLMDKGAFDMIYHEHRDYHTLAPWPAFLKRFGLVIVRTQRLWTHGGSIRVWCERPGVGIQVPTEALDWKAFRHRIDVERERIREVISQVEGPIVAVGATAKACTLLHHFGLTELIDYCVDNTPAKQGRYIPGTNIHISDPSRLRDDPTATILLTAWNFEQEIRAQFPQHDFIVPFSQEVVPCPVR